MSAPAATLADYSDAELCEFYNNHDAGEEWAAQIEAEANRRDDAEAARRQRHAARCARRDDLVTTDWQSGAWSQYLEAERDLCGNLAVTEAPFADAFTLWSGTEAFAMRWATEELRNWWRDVSPRITVTAYRDAVRHQREEYRYGELDRDDAGPIRHASAATSADRAVPGTRPVRHAGHGGFDRSGGAGPMDITRAVIRGAERTVRDHRRSAIRAGATERQEHTAPAAFNGTPGTVAVRQPGTVATAVPQLDGAQVLDFVAAYLDEFASFASPAARDAVALWAAHSHARGQDGRLAWRATPRLLLVSSEPGSGKSRVLELLGRLCPNTFGLDTEPTVAALAHTIGREHATVLIDEADVLFGRGARKEGVRAVLNSGYLRNGTTLKMRGGKADRVAIFGPVALAGLDVIETATGGTLEALLSRCIRIRMSRAAGPVADLTDRADRGGYLLRQALGSWTGSHTAGFAAAEPELPEGVHGRTAEIWTPLLAIAEAAGADWPDRAWTALYELAVRGGVSSSEDTDAMTELADMFGDLTTSWD